MKCRILFLLVASSLCASAQAWSTFLDPSRAVDWSSVSFKIPNYTINCPTQPSLTAGDQTAATANRISLEAALASCDSTHNVVNIPAGTYYIDGWNYGPRGKRVVRGAGPMSTTVILTATATCGLMNGICLAPSSVQNHGGTYIMPPSGKQQCAWTGGLSQGSNPITLSQCGGGPPPVGAMLYLDQANDAVDTGGIFVCDTSTYSTYQCTNQKVGNNNGRVIGGVGRSQQQVVAVTAVVNNNDGTYTVTLSRPVYFTNIRAAQSPGVYWLNMTQNDGLENITIDHGSVTANTPIAIVNCYQCWVRNVRSLTSKRAHVLIWNGLDDVVRDNYFYAAQGAGSQSYGVEFEVTSGVVVENNIFHQTTTPIMSGQGAGNVVGYNYSVNNIYNSTFMMFSNYAHNAGNEMNLWEGNNLNGINCDASSWGSSAQGTFFRNFVNGWQSGKSNATFPIALGGRCRAFNLIGNVLGQPKVHSNYESYATSSTAGVNGGTSNVNSSIYSLGWTGIAGIGGCSGPPTCDSLVRPTLMRWGNFDTATGTTKWDAGEASATAVPYVNANFSSSYFSSLSPALPASLYYNSKPSWWPTSKAWPPIGPDVSSGNLGVCNGAYKGSQATAAGQCGGGGDLNIGWAAHANSIPAQDCYLNVMQGPPDGSGSVLSFDARQCYGSTIPAPTGVKATVRR
jgi:hypothetical protein